MQIPNVGSRTVAGKVATYGGDWSSSPNNNTDEAYSFSFGPDTLAVSNLSLRGNGYAVRCFKDTISNTRI
jgi:hypothetical protein